MNGGAPGAGAHAGRSGASGSPPEAGAGGAVSLGGSAGGDAAGEAGAGGEAQPSAPFWWACAAEAYGDGVCDCGCSIRDVDCQDGDVDSCEVCSGPGSCNGAPCPGRIKAEDNRHCDPYPPQGWVCPQHRFADETSCDCGCGVVDPDCEDATYAACDSCDLAGSCSLERHDGCSTSIDPNDNSRCHVPPEWECYGNYRDGICDCGCGIVDVDCSSSSVEACENCTSGCSVASCAEISPNNNGVCTPPPPGWHCDEHTYLDGALCDCGCGIADPDCAGTGVESCDSCSHSGNCSVQPCPGTIDPNDITGCYQPEPPSWWTCPASAYADGSQCDCGCGAYDLDCPDGAVSSCDECGACGPCPGTVNPMNPPSCL